MPSLKVLVITVAKALPHPLHPPAHGYFMWIEEASQAFGMRCERSQPASRGWFVSSAHIGGLPVFACTAQPEFPSPLGQCGPCSN